MYRIIIADDEEYVRELLASNINRSQKEFEVIAEAGDGREAIELVEKLQPDILIADICMPFVDGLELIRHIRQSSGNIKTVIISGYDDFAYAQQALTLGVTDYLLKPFSPEELYEVLDKIRDELECRKVLMNNIRDMKSQLEDASRISQEHVVQKLVQRTENAAKLLEEVKRAGICPEGLLCAAGILQIYQDGQERIRDIKELLTVTVESYFQKNCRIYLSGTRERQMILLFLGDYQNIRIFRKAIENGIMAILESLRHYYDIFAGCVIGGIYADWKQISKSYENILSIWKKNYENAGTVLFLTMRS